MSYSSTPPSKTDHHWVRWTDTGHEFTTKVGGTDDYPNREGGRDPDMEYGPRIPSPEELVAMEECVRLSRLINGDAATDREQDEACDSMSAALSRLDAIRKGER